MSKPWSQDVSKERLSQSEIATPSAVAQIMSRVQLATQESQGRLTHISAASDSLWPPLWAEMMRQDEHLREPSPGAPPGMEQQVERLVHLCTQMALSDQTLHLAVALLRDVGPQELEPALAELGCLKLAEAMCELSHEYYTRERTESFAEASPPWTEEQIIAAERLVFERVQVRLRRPTADWFLRASLSAGAGCEPWVQRVAEYINTLCLYDTELQVQPAALRAQSALLIAVFACRSQGQGDGLGTFWDQVRAQTCWLNTKELVFPFFARMCHLVTAKRCQWALEGLGAVERRHPFAARSLPEMIPLDLANELLP